MFVETFKIKTNSWHVKLVKYMWDLDYYEFTHICPYFWLVVGSLLILPIYLPLRGIRAILIAIDKWMDEREEKEFQRQISKLKNKKEYNIFLNYSDKKWNKFKRYIHNLDAAYDYDDVLYEIREKRKAMELNKILLDEEKEENASRLQKQRINKILKWIKPLSVVVIWVGSFVLFTLLIYSFIYLYQNYSFDPKTFYYTLMVFGIMMGFVLAISFMVFLLKKLASPKIQTKLNRLGTPFSWLFRGISFICIIIFQMIKNHCPSIDWENK